MVSYRQKGSLQAGERRNTTPDGLPAPTGYYPNIYRGTSNPGVQPKKPIMFQHRRDTSPYEPDWQQFDRTIYKQHMPVFRNSSTIVPDKPERPSGTVDPLESGPVAPQLRMLSRNFRIQSGTSNTRNLDNNIAQKSPIGQKDGVTWTTTIDPVISNARLSAPQYDENGNQLGSMVRIPPSGPYGLHGRTPTHKRSQAQSNATRQARAQQVGAKVDRLANSQYVGQSYSATTTHVTGTPSRGNRRGLR